LLIHYVVLRQTQEQPPSLTFHVSPHEQELVAVLVHYSINDGNVPGQPHTHATRDEGFDLVVPEQGDHLGFVAPRSPLVDSEVIVGEDAFQRLSIVMYSGLNSFRLCNEFRDRGTFRDRFDKDNMASIEDHFVRRVPFFASLDEHI
jgi:hypothetical protein